MSGFRNIGEWVDAYEAGQTWSVFLNKGSAPSSVTIGIFDWTTTGGYPTANFYASSPLVSAHMDSGVRPYVPSVSPSKQYLKTLRMIILDPSSSTLYGYGMEWMLLDYLMYYPFVDLTAVSELQEMTNTVTLPRYTTGNGVQMMLVSQSAVTGAQTMTVTYINQSGVQKTTPAFYVTTTVGIGLDIAGGSSSVTSNHARFIPLAAGDSGVRSVVSATINGDAGGIAAIVLVKPLHIDYTTDSSHRTTTNTVIYGAFSQTEMLLQAPPVQLEDGAFLGFSIRSTAASHGGCRAIAQIETVWN